MRIETCGGGGYGPAWQRDPNLSCAMSGGEGQPPACAGRMAWSSTPAPGGRCRGNRRLRQAAVELYMSARFRVGVDIGGTFTDAVLVSETDGAASPSPRCLRRRPIPSVGFLGAVERILKKAGREPQGPVLYRARDDCRDQRADRRQDPATAFLTTRGFRDMLEIGRQVRPSLYDVHFEKPRPLVPRNFCFEVASASTIRARSWSRSTRLRSAPSARRWTAEERNSVAVCFLHAYLNPAHERASRRSCRRRIRRSTVSLSARGVPEFREYFRASTTVINACLALWSLLSRKASRQTAWQVELKPSYCMQSNGGVLTFAAGGRKTGIHGRIGAGGRGHRGYFHRRITRIPQSALARHGRNHHQSRTHPRWPAQSHQRVRSRAPGRMPAAGQIRGNGYPIRVPVLDLVEIGAGAAALPGSTAGGVLRVGPASAGADPGPVCYGRGGSDPTLTDANLVLGRLNPGFSSGARCLLNRAAAEEAIRPRCAEPLGMSPTDAALGIVEIANAAMINALRLVSIRRGFDPRDFVLVAFGGAAPLHVNRLAAEMQIPLRYRPAQSGHHIRPGACWQPTSSMCSPTREFCAPTVCRQRN